MLHQAERSSSDSHNVRNINISQMNDLLCAENSAGMLRLNIAENIVERDHLDNDRFNANLSILLQQNALSNL